MFIRVLRFLDAYLHAVESVAVDPVHRALGDESVLVNQLDYAENCHSIRSCGSTPSEFFHVMFEIPAHAVDYRYAAAGLAVDPCRRSLSTSPRR